MSNSPSLEETGKATPNEDPITGERGAHPVATGVGAVMGAAVAGAIAGTVAGPVGTVVGTVVGGIAGAVSGRAVGESLNPTVETEFWRSEYRRRPYYQEQFPFESYHPAYRAGWESAIDTEDWMAGEKLAKSKYDEDKWETEGGAPKLSWEEAKQAARDAYDRAHSQRRDKDNTFVDIG